MDSEIRIGKWVEELVSFMLDHFQSTFDTIATVVNGFGGAIDYVLVGAPAWLLIGLIVAISLWRVGVGFAVFTVAALVLIAGMGLWTETASTLGLVLTATLLSLLVGVPLGVWMARNRVVESIVRTTLDFMQTMPAFVYLIPAAMVFGLGRVPGILATVVFAMPPVVRLTGLGIRQVNSEQVEAGHAFGCNGLQLLWKVQLPIALPTIMAGVNQTIMMALSMVIIASMVGAGGLGNDVLSSIQRLDIGLGFESGLSVVLLAIILDRLTESFGTRHLEA